MRNCSKDVWRVLAPSRAFSVIVNPGQGVILIDGEAIDFGVGKGVVRVPNGPAHLPERGAAEAGELLSGSQSE